MYELVQISKSCHYINCPAKIGVYHAGDNQVYLIDSGSDKEAGRKVRQILDKEAPIFVPAHADASADLKELIGFNRDKVHEVAEVLLDICTQPLNFEAILQRLFEHYDLTMTMQQYALVGSTVKSYLSWLNDSGRMTLEIQDNLVLWKTV